MEEDEDNAYEITRSAGAPLTALHPHEIHTKAASTVPGPPASAVFYNYLPHARELVMGRADLKADAHPEVGIWPACGRAVQQERWRREREQLERERALDTPQGNLAGTKTCRASSTHMPGTVSYSAVIAALVVTCVTIVAIHAHVSSGGTVPTQNLNDGGASADMRDPEPPGSGVWNPWWPKNWPQLTPPPPPPGPVDMNKGWPGYGVVQHRVADQEVHRTQLASLGPISAIHPPIHPPAEKKPAVGLQTLYEVERQDAEEGFEMLKKEDEAEAYYEPLQAGLSGWLSPHTWSPTGLAAPTKETIENRLYYDPLKAGLQGWIQPSGKGK